MRRIVRAIGLCLIAAAISTGGVLASHTEGTLYCGDAGTFQVEGVELAGYPFGAPPPQSGIFLLEGTQVFRAFSNDRFGIAMIPATLSARPLITCELTSEGLGGPWPWVLRGMLLP
jgi:hypothetical protein